MYLYLSSHKRTFKHYFVSVFFVVSIEVNSVSPSKEQSPVLDIISLQNLVSASFVLVQSVVYTPSFDIPFGYKKLLEEDISFSSLKPANVNSVFSRTSRKHVFGARACCPDIEHLMVCFLMARGNFWNEANTWHEAMPRTNSPSFKCIVNAGFDFQVSNTSNARKWQVEADP